MLRKSILDPNSTTFGIFETTIFQRVCHGIVWFPPTTKILWKVNKGLCILWHRPFQKWVLQINPLMKFTTKCLRFSCNYASVEMSWIQYTQKYSGSWVDYTRTKKQCNTVTLCLLLQFSLIIISLLLQFNWENSVRPLIYIKHTFI